MTTINYNGQELECITEGYWPEGVTLIGKFGLIADVILLHEGFAHTKRGVMSSPWDKYAILPPKQAPRRLTNREIYNLWRNGWDVCSCGTIGTPEYSIHDENEAADDDVSIRAPGSDEWVEPTSDLLEVGK